MKIIQKMSKPIICLKIYIYIYFITIKSEMVLSFLTKDIGRALIFLSMKEELHIPHLTFQECFHIILQIILVKTNAKLLILS